MESVIYWINDIVWSQALVILCLGTGLFFSFRLKFPQIRLFKEMIRLLFGTKRSNEGISSFQAFTLAISGRIGTGNIAGVATAIAMGGQGAIFWMLKIYRVLRRELHSPRMRSVFTFLPLEMNL